MSEAVWDPETVSSTFTRHPAYDRILSCLSPASLVSMGRVSRITRRAVQDYSSRAFSVNRLLTRFFSDPVAFRSLQARTATLISGSFGVQLFDRSLYSESDLDLYPHSQHVREVGEWLRREGYIFMPSSFQPESFLEASAADPIMTGVNGVNLLPLDHYWTKSVANVFTFLRPSTDAYNPDQPAKVQIIKSKESPFECILNFHSTCVMNIITYNAAISLYPFSTFERREALVIGGNDRQASALRKYAERGWRMIAHSSPLIVLSSPDSVTFGDHFFVQKTRWTDDRHSWVIPLDMDQVSEPTPLSPTSMPLTWDPVMQNS
ncbi:hypothetical protein BKA93DRAFT_753336 [Sparassis latifolia]